MFLLMGSAFVATGPFNPHPWFILMGVLSFCLALAAPSVWWVIALLIALPPALLTLGADPIYLPEVLLLAFVPALLAYCCSWRRILK